MPSSDVLSAIQAGMSGFSKGQKLIAKYILDYYDKAAFMTACVLGRTVGVSESTVVRFALEIGFSGYPAMQKALQEMILNRLTSVQRIEVANDRIGDQDIVSMVLQADIDKIRATNDATDRAAFDGAVDAILAAKNIYILGVRSSSALAGFLGFYFNYMFDNVHLVTTSASGEMFEHIVRVAPGDVVIGISFPRYSTSTIKAISHCKSVGATVIALTDSMHSPVGKCADYVLVAKSDMVSLVDSLVAPMSLINAVIVAIAAKREKEVSHIFTNLERLWDEYEVYEKVDV